MTTLESLWGNAFRLMALYSSYACTTPSPALESAVGKALIQASWLETPAVLGAQHSF